MVERVPGIAAFARGAAIGAAVIATAVPAAAGERTVEVTSPHFVVYSDAGEAAARDLAVRAERVRATFARVWPWARVDTGAPVFILAAGGEGLRSVLPVGTKNVDRIPGWSTHGPERHYFLARTDLKGGDALVDSWLLGGYADVVVEQSFTRSPLWLSVGVSQLFAQTQLKADGTAEFGHPLPWLKWAKGTAPVPVATLLATKSYADLKPDQRGPFWTSCWALAHWLVIDQTLAGNRAVGQFLKHVAEGVAALDALRQAGLDAAQIDAAVLATLTAGDFRVVALRIPAEDASAWRARPVSKAEWQAVSALYFAEFGRGPAAGGAEARAREALRAEPGSVLAREALARALWLQSNKWPEIREQLEAAVEASPERLSSRFLAAYVQRDLAEREDAPRQEITRGLEHARRAVALGPEFAPALAVLADLLLLKGEPPAEALALARRAVALEPSQPAHRLVLATALARSGDAAAARRECEATLAQDVEEGLKKKLQQLLASTAGAPAASAPTPATN